MPSVSTTVVSGTGSLAAPSGDSRIIEACEMCKAVIIISSLTFQLCLVFLFYINFSTFMN